MGAIYIETIEDLESFNPETADGFDPEDEKKEEAPALAAAPIQ